MQLEARIPWTELSELLKRLRASVQSADPCRIPAGTSPKSVQVMQQPDTPSFSAITSNAWAGVTD